MTKPWRLCSLCAALAVGATMAQLSAQQTQGSPAFEVAALHLRDRPDAAGVSPLGLGRWSANSVGLSYLLFLSFNLRLNPVQPIVGLPDWSRYEFYSIAV